MLVFYYVLMYVVVPVILLETIGRWAYLVFALWLFGSYFAMKKSCEKREHMPMMEHTEVMGHMMFIAIPTVLSALVFLVLYEL